MQTRTRLFILTLLLLTLSPSLGSAQVAVGGRVAPHSYFGLNLYASALERHSDNSSSRVIAAAGELGVRWTREELSWANIEPVEGAYNFQQYDRAINELATQQIGIIGMLLTTPTWASGQQKGAGGWYWYPPNDAKAYGRFVEATVNHWKDKVAVWELWNEPDKEDTWKPTPNPAAYAALLAEGYAAVKRADPTAQVMLGSVYIHDRGNEGLAFMDQVVAASGGALNFDIMGVHTFMLDRAPEDISPVTVVQNLAYRVATARKWLADHKAGDKPLWITEDGASTCQDCSGLGTTPALQAARLPRQYALAIANGAAQFDYFQVKDKFYGGGAEVWGNMALLDNNWQPKPAYYAYKTLANLVGDGQYVGPGPLLHKADDRWQEAYDRYEYIFKRAGTTIHILWTREDVPGQVVSVVVGQNSVRVVQLNGATQVVAAKTKQVQVQISSSPVYVVEERDPNAPTLDPATDAASPSGYHVASRFQNYWQQHGGLPAFGYPISGERYEEAAADGKSYVVQWYERARMEYHPEFAGTANEVQLGLLGTQAAAGRNFPPAPPSASKDSRYFAETSHNLGGRFLAYWQQTGRLTLYGYPISEAQTESGSDGKPYTMQYFERARFEYHPENQQPYDVLLSLLGRQFEPASR